jgi:uncharacterized lipoprotein YbaY
MHNKPIINTISTIRGCHLHLAMPHGILKDSRVSHCTHHYLLHIIEFIRTYLDGRSIVRGNLLNDDPFPLPFGSQIIITLADISLQDVAARPLNTVVLTGSYRFPIPFEIPYSIAQIQNTNNNFRQYAIQVRIEKDGQLLYINDQHVPVQLMQTPINPINIILKKISTSTVPSSNDF